MHFEGVSSEIIDNGTAALNHMSDGPTALEEVVAHSNTLRENRKFKRPNNEYNKNIISSNNQSNRIGVQNNRN